MVGFRNRSLNQSKARFQGEGKKGPRMTLESKRIGWDLKFSHLDEWIRRIEEKLLSLVPAVPSRPSAYLSAWRIGARPVPPLMSKREGGCCPARGGGRRIPPPDGGPMCVGSGEEHLSVLPPVAAIFAIFGVSFPPAIANRR
jgi:hypothetical protein